MNKYHHLACGLLAGVGTLVLAPMATAQTSSTAGAPEAELTEVVVTGSRVITNGNESPTPVTVVTMEDLQASRPTTVFEGLQELPIFAAGNGGAVGGRTGQGGNNNSIASLNPRGLGSVRGLVLFNGHRVPPQNLNGQTDLNQIPQMVLERVDVQTGGSSAVYGSDAITGAVNFIVNRKFNGLKAHAQYGVSGRGDAESNEIGVALGTDLFSGRGHIMGSVQTHNDSGLMRQDREWTQPADGYSWSLQGSGTAAAPYFATQYAVDSRISWGGVIVCPSGAGTASGAAGTPRPVSCPTRELVGQNFSGNGVLSPFVNGQTAGLAGTNQIGGDGGSANQYVTLKVPVEFAQAYGRFDFDMTDNLHFFVESYYTKEDQDSVLANTRSSSSVTSQLNNGFVMDVNNAFLPASYRQTLVAGGETTFNVGKVWNMNYYEGATFTYNNHNFYVNTGLEGSFGDGWRWELAGTMNEAVQENTAHNTWSTARLFAALDAVMGPNGQPVCWVSTQPQFAGLYPGCVPMNVFGPTATTQAMWDYVREPTVYRGTTDMTDVTGNISGAPFSTWAGKVNMALSGEWRELEYELYSGGEPQNVTALNCAAMGLRYNCVNKSATDAGTGLIFPNGTAGLPKVSQTVKEAAIEMDIPLLADKSYAQRMSINPAFRRAEYSSTGSPFREIPASTTEFGANTWKVGLNWQFNDAYTLRATRSRDFRAPNMSELYLPGRIQGFNVQDRLTGVTGTAQQQVGGNINVQPEVGYTTTMGVVLKPWDKFSLAIDAFQISITDAITSIDGSAAQIQDACYDSGGASEYCALQTRPGGYSRTPANQAPSNTATYWITSLPSNLAELETSGIDLEANYAMALFDRPLQLRFLATYQPHIITRQPFVADDEAAGVTSPVTRTLFSFKYNFTEALSLNWSTRWRSELRNMSKTITNVVPGSDTVASAAYSNMTVTYRLPMVKTGDLDLYFNVLNVFDKAPPAYVPLASGSPFSSAAGTGGVGFYPADDGLGRYFNLGVRYRL